MLSPTIWIVIAGASACALCWLIIYCFLYVFVKSRLDFTSSKILPIKYLPEVIVEELPPEPEVPPHKLKKREKRRLNITRAFSERYPTSEVPDITNASTGLPGTWNPHIDGDDSGDDDDQDEENQQTDDLSLTECDDDEFPATSLLDLDPSANQEICVNKRKQHRLQLKQEMASQGEVDVVKLNSGPPPEFIPPGYVIANIPPRLVLDELKGLRVLYLWEESNAKGWYVGTISGPSRKAGCNFNIKYDKFETKTVFVDGIVNYNLSYVGEDAYGKRWVAIHKSGP